MKCPFCGDTDTQVLDTREGEDGSVVRRRRRCANCQRRFTTYERVDLKPPVVVKRDGSREDFDREKLAASLRLALRKRPVPAETIEHTIERIEAELLSSGASEVPSTMIGEMVMEALKRLDKVAYVRFASVYLNFEDVGKFAELIRDVQASARRKRSEKNTDDDAADLVRS
ncbi:MULTISPECIES: transcriptional regulator NrdR [Tepidiphilus]|jgi:transcriptional repressor NrdR|uniref:Transcriptional repressor NrdR n=1 Tax=Tepidiphilus baoligensis TaxID=2698687 RepID=A0ABX1QJ25_9PROT|nr:MULTISPECIES: transcriptional regulator NrdR [Tepidiphilus]NMH15998.1 transcriptional repressor NrdR [Tepidiphilus baoligensis]